MNDNVDNKVKEAEESAEKNSPQNAVPENPWAELQRLLARMDEGLDENINAPVEERNVPASQVEKTDENIDKPVESKADKAELNAHIKSGEALVEQFQNELRQSLMGLTNTLAEKGLLDKKTLRKHQKRVKREDKRRVKELKKKMREIKKKGS